MVRVGGGDGEPLPVRTSHGRLSSCALLEHGFELFLERIARQHLIPNVTAKHGLDAKEWAIDHEALLTIIRRYTREAGVRKSSVSSRP